MTMTTTERRALERLADMIDQAGLDIYPTIDDDGLYIKVNGELVFTGWLNDSSELRAAIAGGEQEPQR